MKKFFIFTLISFIFTFNGFSQIKVNSVKNDRLVEVKNLHSSTINKLMKKGDAYFFVITKTNNQFDNPMILKLGENKEDILNSLTILYENIDVIGDEETIAIDNGFGIEYKLNKWVLSEEEIKLYKKLKVKEEDLDPCYKVYCKDNAGYGTIWKSALKSAIEFFN